MVEATIDKSQVRAIVRKIEKIIRELNWQTPLKKTGDLLKEEAVRNIDTQGFTYDEYWKPLKESTRKQREKLGYPRARPILVRSGKLKRGFRKSVSKDKVEVYNIVDYSKYHQAGGRYLPKRTILKVSKKGIQAIYLVFTNFINSILKKV